VKSKNGAISLAVNGLVQFRPKQNTLKLAKTIPVCVFLLATLLILRGMSLGIPYLSPDLSAGGASGCHK